MKFVIVAMVALLVVIHQDVWNWHRIEPLIFGFIPVGLAWHTMISLFAAFLAAMMVRFCWPALVEAMESAPDKPESSLRH
jgi:hypothetical protein